MSVERAAGSARDFEAEFPFVFGAEVFTTFCTAPMCNRDYRYYSQRDAQTHWSRTHTDPKHWAYLKPGT